MNLTEEPEIVNWPETHYVFIEKIGPIMNNAPQAWQELHRNVAAIAEKNQIGQFFSLYKMGPDAYRAGVTILAGTDHGAAAPMFLVGSKMKSGLLGAEPSLAPADLKDGDIQYNTDFRSVYASILQDWMKTNSLPILGRQFPTMPIIT